MIHIDAGTTGATETQRDQLAWSDLALSPDWHQIIQILVPNTSPRPVQIEAIQTADLLNSRRNLIVSAPTNSGKSLVGLLMLMAAVRRGQRAVLLEPLRALAQEKADELNALATALSEALGIPLQVTITTGDYRLQDETLASRPPQTGELIIATPERLEAIWRNPDHLPWIESIGAVCIDEAHLISTPHRGPTLEHLVTSFLCLDVPPRIALLSATLGDTSAAEGWLTPCDVVRITDREPPLQKSVLALENDDEPDRAVINLAQEVLSEPSANLLIFVYQTRSAELLAAKLEDNLNGLTGDAGPFAYHGRMSAAQRQQVQQSFQSGASRCLVTTTALGLGVNLPASHVLVRDNTFIGSGRLDVGELLQMMGRAGRGDQPGSAQVLVRPTDGWKPDELALALCEEKIADFTSSLAQAKPEWHRVQSDADSITSAANLVAARLVRASENGLTLDELQAYFARSLGGQCWVEMVPAALQWLADPMRLLAYKDEHDRYHLTVLGRKATLSVFPLPMAAGLAQLLRDLLTIDPEDQLLARWSALDHLLVLNLLYDRGPNLRTFSKALVEQVDGWFERTPEHQSLLYTEWLRGEVGHAKAEEVFGSLGIANPPDTKDSGEWARKRGYLALFQTILLYERSNGHSTADLAREWRLKQFDGIEERWRDDMLWLLSGFGKLLDIRTFYYHLREECSANPDRVRTVKHHLRTMNRQVYELQESLKYCSPLGSVLLAIRRTHRNRSGSVIGIQSIRTLEAAGVSSVAQLVELGEDDLVEIGVKRRFARQVVGYLQRRGQ